MLNKSKMKLFDRNQRIYGEAASFKRKTNNILCDRFKITKNQDELVHYSAELYFGSKVFQQFRND